MIEKLKSVTLAVMICLSLVLSYLLAYSYPQLEPLAQEKYVKADPVGTQAVLEDLLFPDQMVLHLGEQVHTVLYPSTRSFNSILDTVKQRYIEGFRKINTATAVLPVTWDEIRDKQQGVELRFRDGVPFNVLQRVMQIKGELPIDNDVVTRIWIYTKETKDDVRTFFFTDSPGVAYEAIKADFTVKDIEKFVQLGADQTPYTPGPGESYLPTKPLTMPAYKVNFSLMTADQLKRSFFVDPAITRNLTERDGSEIYTDGKRGLQLKNDQHWMAYSDPVAPVETKQPEIRENLLAAIQFVNQHGGWNGQYVVNKVPQRMATTSQSFVFRQYFESLPVINERQENIGFIKIVLQKGVVSSFERSVIVPENRTLSAKDTQIAGGEALGQKLAQYEKRSSVVAIYPAYKPVTDELTLELVPAWAVELRDGSYEFLE
ncbi:YycH family regulatory protein [Paenibacillus hamazuiensis]|uniref:YycH family regulatory protein n=1 Tax=Paenibacillus hamazuiensis TaxID=2936508 RepID=UPI00200C02CF|nr:two-component system activity regulator YycH [Paenibacillus hamazuiensis]